MLIGFLAQEALGVDNNSWLSAVEMAWKIMTQPQADDQKFNEPTNFASVVAHRADPTASKKRVTSRAYDK